MKNGDDTWILVFECWHALKSSFFFIMSGYNQATKLAWIGAKELYVMIKTNILMKVT